MADCTPPLMDAGEIVARLGGAEATREALSDAASPLPVGAPAEEPTAAAARAKLALFLHQLHSSEPDEPRGTSLPLARFQRCENESRVSMMRAAFTPGCHRVFWRHSPGCTAVRRPGYIDADVDAPSPVAESTTPFRLLDACPDGPLCLPMGCMWARRRSLLVCAWASSPDDRDSAWRTGCALWALPESVLRLVLAFSRCHARASVLDLPPECELRVRWCDAGAAEAPLPVLDAPADDQAWAALPVNTFRGTAGVAEFEYYDPLSIALEMHAHSVDKNEDYQVRLVVCELKRRNHA